jgi:hypothetical protein
VTTVLHNEQWLEIQQKAPAAAFWTGLCIGIDELPEKEPEKDRKERSRP